MRSPSRYPRRTSAPASHREAAGRAAESGVPVRVGCRHPVSGASTVESDSPEPHVGQDGISLRRSVRGFGHGDPKPEVGLPKSQPAQIQNVRHGSGQKHVTLRRANLTLEIPFEPQFPIAVNDLPFLFEKEVPGLPCRTQCLVHGITTTAPVLLGLRMECVDSLRDLPVFVWSDCHDLYLQPMVWQKSTTRCSTDCRVHPARSPICSRVSPPMRSARTQ
jgi:hypothetical protein